MIPVRVSFWYEFIPILTYRSVFVGFAKSRPVAHGPPRPSGLAARRPAAHGPPRHGGPAARWPGGPVARWPGGPVARRRSGKKLLQHVCSCSLDLK